MLQDARRGKRQMKPNTKVSSRAKRGGVLVYVAGNDKASHSGLHGGGRHSQRLSRHVHPPFATRWRINAWGYRRCAHTAGHEARAPLDALTGRG